MRCLQFDHECLRIETEKGVSDRLEWASVLEVFAFKDDVFGTDIICIGFRTDDMGFHWKIDEEYEGYKDLKTFLPEVFPGIRTDWFSDVAFPPLATCLTSLWGEQSDRGDLGDRKDPANPRIAGRSVGA